MSKARKPSSKTPAKPAAAKGGDSASSTASSANANAANANTSNANLADRVAGPATAMTGPMDVGGADVVESSEAGGYYCEHTLFSTLDEATKEGSSVVEGEGGKLAGFLHLPDDEQTYDKAEVADQGKRHEKTRKVVGAAFRGYFDQISLRGGVADGEPYRIMITGFGSFMDSIQNNPTGDFAAHEENLTAAMQAGFGSALIGGPEQVNVAQTDRFLQRAKAGGGAEVAEYYTATWKYQVQEPATCDVRDVLITAIRLPVTDQAIDPKSPGSVQDAMNEFGPQAVLSMGVVPDNNFEEQTYRAETRADDQNLKSDENQRRSHQWDSAPTREHESRGLANAIRAGSSSIGPATKDPTKPAAPTS